MGGNQSNNTNVNNSHDVHICRARLFKAMATQSHEILPNITSTHIKSIKFDHGHAIATGSIFTVFYADGSHVKIGVDDVDSENHVIKFTTLDGSILGDKFEKISSIVKLEELGDEKTIVNLSAEYHTKDHHEPTSAEINAANEQAEKFYKAFEEYLIDHPNISA